MKSQAPPGDNVDNLKAEYIRALQIQTLESNWIGASAKDFFCLFLNLYQVLTKDLLQKYVCEKTYLTLNVGPKQCGNHNMRECD